MTETHKKSHTPFHHRDHKKKIVKEKHGSLTEFNYPTSEKIKEIDSNTHYDKKYEGELRINPTGASKRNLKNPADATGNLMKKGGKTDNFASHYSNSNGGAAARNDILSAKKAFEKANIDDHGNDLPEAITK